MRFWWCRIAHWFWMRVTHSFLGEDGANVWHCHRCGRWWRQGVDTTVELTKDEIASEQEFLRAVCRDMQTL